MVFGVGTQLPRRPVMMRRPNARAGGGWYLFSFEVRVCHGRVTLPCKSLRGVRAPNIVSAGHMPNSSAQFIYSIHRFKSYALFISLVHPLVQYAQIIRPSHTLKPYPQAIHPNHTPMAYAQTICPSHMPKPYTQAIRLNHNESRAMELLCSEFT